MSDTCVVGADVRLRPVAEADLSELLRLLWERRAPGDYQWFGFRMDTARHLERRWHDDGLIGDESSYLAVEVDSGACAGWVTWRPAGAKTEIGIALFPEHRGRGIGTEAQRQLASYLFSTTPVHRLQAGTESDNVAEQRALEAVGFRREGVHRGVYFRDGGWRDSMMYGLLRDEFMPPSTDAAASESAAFPVSALGTSNPVTVNVRRARAADVEACLSIVRGLPEFFTEDVGATVQAELVRDHAWVAEEQTVVGFAVARERFPRTAEITWAAVESGRRHCGIGTKMIEHVLNELAARGRAVVEVKTLDDTAPYEPYVATRRFWERLGFVKIDVIDPLPGWQLGNPSAIYAAALAVTR